MTAFASATAVAPAGDGVYTVDLHPDWTIAGKSHGGYLLAVLARAALAEAGTSGSAHVHPIASSAHYVAAPEPGPAEVHTEVLRTGRTVSQVRARLVQDGGTRLDGTFTLGTLEAGTTPFFGTNPVAEQPAAEACFRVPSVEPSSGIELSFMKAVDLDVDPAMLGFAMGAPRGLGEFAGRMAFADGAEPDALALLLAADILPPVTMDLGSIGWVPTLELTVYVRALPSPGPLTVQHRARLIEGGLMDEVCDVWDATGRLVAQGHQLAAPRATA